MIQPLNTTSPLVTNDSLPGSMVNPGAQNTGDSFQGALSTALSTTPASPATVNPEAGNLFVEVAALNWPSSTTPPLPTANTTATAVTSSSSSSATSGDSSTDSTQSFDDAYWASQPPAVQALRGMENEDQRIQLATQLQQQGYTIDVPIMVWHWDPSATTTLRQNFGYTWVPALGQSPIQVMPGLTVPGQFEAYNPNDPPPGSIIVPPTAS